MKCLLWHTWGKWGRPFRFAYDAYQNRICLKCGKSQQRKYGWFDEPYMYDSADKHIQQLKRDLAEQEGSQDR